MAVVQSMQRGPRGRCTKGGAAPRSAQEITFFVSHSTKSTFSTENLESLPESRHIVHMVFVWLAQLF